MPRFTQRIAINSLSIDPSWGAACWASSSCPVSFLRFNSKNPTDLSLISKLGLQCHYIRLAMETQPCCWPKELCCCGGFFLVLFLHSLARGELGRFGAICNKSMKLTDSLSWLLQIYITWSKASIFLCITSDEPITRQKISQSSADC